MKKRIASAVFLSALIVVLVGCDDGDTEKSLNTATNLNSGAAAAYAALNLHTGQVIGRAEHLYAIDATSVGPRVGIQERRDVDLTGVHQDVQDNPTVAATTQDHTFLAWLGRLRHELPHRTL